MAKFYIGRNANYLLFVSQFNETRIFLSHFRQILKHQVSWKSVQWEPSYSMQTDGQTDRHDETYSRTSKFSNRPKNW